MATILEQIVSTKGLELDIRKKQEPLSELQSQVRDLPIPLNFSGALMGGGISLIAETKKASPSKGLLKENYDPVMLAQDYIENGASAVSVITEKDHFQGSLAHLKKVKEAVGPRGIPVLRKDFLFDTYQVYEAKVYGADAILLIAAILEKTQLKELLQLSQSLWIQVLTEVHNEQELEMAIECGAEVIGINNRNLHTFDTNISLTERLAIGVPTGKILVSESGIQSHNDLMRLEKAGVHAVLVGEALVTSDDPGAKTRELLYGNLAET